MSKTILLTSVFQPLGPRHGDGPSVGYELLHGQVTRAQGLFSPRAVHRYFSLDYMAENLDTEAVVLQYPTKRALIQELKKGYDYVAVSFILALFHRMKDTVALIRKHAPTSKIILGGYGTVLSDDVLAPFADHICREEGVAFVRALLGEPALPAPYKHPLVLSELKVFSVPIAKTGMIFAGLGCPNGCDFCCTSHFFKRKHIKLLPTGQDIYNVVTRYLDRNPRMSMVVLDEDFLLDKKRAMEFRTCVMEGGRDVSLFVFSSIRAISQYTVTEILEMGVDGFWIGYEGTRSDYAKQAGRPVDEVFRELREHGITILASMIVGFPYQTPDIVKKELAGLAELKPALSQFLIYGPTPGTPFYERIMKEGLLHKDLADDREAYYRKCDGFTSMVRHPIMTAEQIEGLQRDCFEEDYQRLGPSIYRSVETNFLGYKTLRGSANPHLRRKARWLAAEVRKAYPIFLAGRLFGPNRQIRRWIASLESEMHSVLGRPSWKERVLSILSVGMAAWTSFKLRTHLFQDPKPQRTVHPARKAQRQTDLLWEKLRSLDLPLSLERGPENAMRVRLHEALSAVAASELGGLLRKILAERREQLILDFQKLVHLGEEPAHRLAAALQNVRAHIRIHLPDAQYPAAEVISIAFGLRSDSASVPASATD